MPSFVQKFWSTLIFALLVASPQILAQRVFAQRGSAQQTSLEVWHAYGDTETVGLRAAIDAFQAAHPEYRVTLTAIPFDAYNSKLNAAVPAGNGPDLFIDAHDRLVSYRRDGLVGRALLGSEREADVEARYYNSICDNQGCWGVPLNEKAIVLFVRTGDARLAGVDLSSIAALLAVREQPLLAWEVTNSYFAAPIFHAFGARYLNEADQTYGLDSDAGVRGLAAIHALMQRGLIPRDLNTDLVKRLFVSGQVPLAVSGPWMASDFPASLEYSVMPLPAFLARTLPAELHGRDATRPFSTLELAFVNAHSSHQEGALLLARFLGGSQSAEARARLGKQVVPNESVYRNNSLDAHLRGFRDAMRGAVITPVFPTMRDTFLPTDRALRSVVRGDASPQNALREAARRFRDETRPPPAAQSTTPALVILLLLSTGLVFLLVRGFRKPANRLEIQQSLPAYGYAASALVAVGLLVFLPLVVGVGVSFFAGRGRDLHFAGLGNYWEILTARGGPLLGHGSFWFVLLVTVLWTLMNLLFHVALGVSLALLLQRLPDRLSKIARVILILPWAVPSYVSALAWKAMFHAQFGSINALLAAFGVSPVGWFSSFQAAFSANLLTNVWLGFPFMLVVTTSALASIPTDVLEAAEIDGATRSQRFRYVIMPLLAPAMLPAIAMGAIWTFNMFNVVFLVSAGEPDGSTEILVSDAYRWAFERGQQLGYASAYAVLIFLLLTIFGRMQRRLGEAVS